MAHNAGSTLYMYFKDAGDDPVNMSVPFVDPTKATDANVKTLADTIVDNSDLWDQAPVEKVGAELVTMSVIEKDISD